MEESVPNWVCSLHALGNEFTGKQENHWLHNGRNLTVCALILGELVSLGWLGEVLKGLAYVPLAALGFGWGYFALMILVVHEASHGIFLRIGHQSQGRGKVTILEPPVWLVGMHPLRH